MQTDRVKMEISKAGTKEKKSLRLNIYRVYHPPSSHYYRPQAVNELPNKPNLQK